MARVGIQWLFLCVLTGAASWGCGTKLGSLFAPQELSENYALLPGTTAESHWRNQVQTVPALVDGNAETVGTTAREIVIILPEPRAIRRIVTRNSNYEDVILYVGGHGEDEWHLVTQVKQNEEPSIVINVSTVTDRIRLRIGNTHDDQHGTSERRTIRDALGIRQTTFKPGEPRAGEIEIYGLRPRQRVDDELF